jgi:hypothetical protein
MCACLIKVEGGSNIYIERDRRRATYTICKIIIRVSVFFMTKLIIFLRLQRGGGARPPELRKRGKARHDAEGERG